MMKQVKFGNALRMFTLSAGLLLSASAFAQSITVKGNVKDETGEQPFLYFLQEFL